MTFSATAFLLTTVLVGTLAACSVPVFRYALEKWPSDPYELVIFHKGTLPAEQQTMVDRLSDDKNPAARQFANVRVRTVNLEKDPPADLAALWKEQKDAALPWMVVRYPLTHPIPSPWAGTISSETVALLLDSPARQELARRVLQGQTAVWLFLESGDRAADDASFAILKAALAKSQQTLKLPEIKAEDIRDGLVSVDPTELRVEFSAIRVSRADPAERMLVEMLLGSEEDLRDTKEPMAFPAFGRGRVLYALVGAGINEETVAEGCQTLVGECTCQIKEQNPGIDLVMSIDWQHLVQPKFDGEKPLPPLLGLGNFLGESKSPLQVPQDSTAAPTRETNSDAQAVKETVVRDRLETPTVPASEPVRASAPAATELRESAVLRNSILAAGVLVVVVFGASLFLLRNKG